MNLYAIKQWDDHYENSRSRKVGDLSWVPIPNRHDGENFSAIMVHPNGAEIYAAWILILQVASRCQPRGTLLRDNGQPHTAQTLSIKTRAPAKWFSLALDFLTKETDWLDVAELAQECQHTDTQIPLDYQSSAEEQKEQKERTEANSVAAGDLVFPSNLSTPEFGAVWARWERHRKEKRQKLTPTTIESQLEMLSKLGVESAIASINQSIEKGWQGLFEPAHKPQPRKAKFQP